MLYFSTFLTVLYFLYQTTTCDSEACYTYRWRQSEWTLCTVDITESCGLGITTRSTVCERSDGFKVDKHFCGKGNIVFLLDAIFTCVLNIIRWEECMLLKKCFIAKKIIIVVVSCVFVAIRSHYNFGTYILLCRFR